METKYNFLSGYINGSISGLVQNTITYPLDTLKIRIQKGKNIRSNFFSGIGESSLSTILTTSLGFGTNEFSKRYVSSEYKSGFIAGIVNGIICTPLESLKIRKQLNYKVLNKFYIYKGFNATLARECIGNSIYFGVYNDMTKNKEKTNINILVSGGIAGSLSWFITYPIDVIKTRVQTGLTYKEALKNKQFIKGLGYCLLRSFLGNAIGFYVYEKLK